ncbi:hypothetical protein [Neobacillus drentensis]|uniref:hypothetical protein n=1 Tax=Neobacillus drentensis TaxID=220684 RepID=UPI002FFE0369
MNNFGWTGSFKEFVDVEKHYLVNTLCLHQYNQTLKEAKENPVEDGTLSQIAAWYDCIRYLKDEIPFIEHLPGYLIFEYEILRSGRRRPDVLLFLPGELLVLEFKSYTNVYEDEYIQTSFYVRDLQQYHSAVQKYNLNVRGALVVTKETKAIEGIQAYQIYKLGVSGLKNLIQRIEKKLPPTELIPSNDFLSGVFQPLPFIIESASFYYEGGTTSAD